MEAHLTLDMGTCPINTKYVVFWDRDRERCPVPLVMLVATSHIPWGGVITRPDTAKDAEHVWVDDLNVGALANQYL